MEFFVVLILASVSPQKSDVITFGEHNYAIQQVPMLGYWDYGKGSIGTGKVQPPNFDILESTNWSGYKATWEISNSKLLLTSISGSVGGKIKRNEDLVRNRKFPCKATWFTGVIEIPAGGYDATKELYSAIIEIRIKAGDVKSMGFRSEGILTTSWNGLSSQDEAKKTQSMPKTQLVPEGRLTP
jgi:hypothetical protein